VTHTAEGSVIRMKKFASLFLVASAAGALAFAAMNKSSGRLPPQPIAFNHRLHLERVQGIKCQDCHQLAASEVYAGIPSKYICFGCHEPNADASDPNADANKPQFATLMAFAKSDGDIPWLRVTTTQEDVFFSHRRHVTVAKIECQQCHRDMPERTSPPTEGPVKIRMSTCLGCHREHQSSVDCISCHR
jgi:hypothetical protein